ncbi:MAG: nucleotidyltransferase domain-containing protein [Candidatus Heimdallarchaeota archaeon]
MLYIHERRILNEIVNLVEQDEAIEKAILFGSVAQQTHLPFSDVDVLLVTKAVQNTQKKFHEIANTLYLKYCVPISFHYVQSGTESVSFHKAIINGGILLWERNK